MMARMKTPIITRSNLNTCPPYITRYPIPPRETKNSPTITPTQDRPILIFKRDIILAKLAGRTSLVSI